MFPEQREAAVAFAAKRRAAGEAVDLALHAQKPKKFFSHAAESGAADAAFLGPDDVARGRVRVKNLATREETEIDL
jgi:histidyl-tRNA synthetase